MSSHASVSKQAVNTQHKDTSREGAPLTLHSSHRGHRSSKLSRLASGLTFWMGRNPRSRSAKHWENEKLTVAQRCFLGNKGKWGLWDPGSPQRETHVSTFTLRVNGVRKTTHKKNMFQDLKIICTRGKKTALVSASVTKVFYFVLNK